MSLYTFEKVYKGMKVGIMEHLSLFFKAPIGTDEYALDQQYQTLLEYVKNFEDNA